MSTEPTPIVPPGEDWRRVIYLLKAVTDNVNDALFVKDIEGRYLFCNPVAAQIVGQPSHDILGSDDERLFGADAAKVIRAQDRRVMAEEITETEDHLVRTSGDNRLFEVTKSPFRDLDGAVIGVVGVARDITNKRAAEAALYSQQAILERVAQGAPLHEILNDLVAMIERFIPGVVGSFLLLDRDGRRLHVAAGKSLPEAYNSAIEGIEIGPQVGSCGTAVYRGEPVLVDDIATDPLWAGFKDLALSHGLRACWSTPILSRNSGEKRVLGTFAVYARQAGPPDKRLNTWIARMEHLACIAIENHESNQNLKASEGRFRAFVENTTDAFFLHEVSGVVRDVNDQACRQLGYSREELTGVMPYAIDPITTPDQMRSIQAAMEQGQRITFETQHRRKDGTLFPVEVRLSPFSQGNDVYAISTVHDITNRKENEDAILKLSDFRQSIIRTAAEGICVCHSVPDYPFVQFSVWNERMNELTGYTLEEINRLGWFQTMYPDPSIQERAINRMTLMRDGNDLRAEEWEITRKDGELRSVTISTSSLEIEGGIQAVVALIQDVTDRKRAASEAEASQRFVQAVAAASPLTIYVFDVALQRIIYSNYHIVRDLGFDIENLQALDWHRLVELVHPDDREKMPTLLSRWESAADGQMLEAEYRLKDAQGAWHWFKSRDTVFTRTADGRVGQIIGTAEDITEQKHAEEALRESERRFRELADAIPQIVWVAGPDGALTHLNAKAAEYTGVSAQKLSGWSWDQVIHPDDLPKTVAQWTEILQTGIPRDIEFRIRRVDGEYRWHITREVPVRNSAGSIETWYGTCTDIEEFKQAERSLRLTQFSIDRAVDSVFWVSPSSEILYVNDAACQTLGYAREELVGKTVPDIDPNFPRESWAAHWEEIKRRGSFTFESEHATKDGRMLRTEVTVNYLQYDGQEYNCAVMRDISARKRAEEERDRLWNHSLDVLCIAGFDGHFKHVNPAWTRSLGWSEEETLSRSSLDFIHPDDLEATILAGNQLTQGKPVIGFENRYRCKDGSYRWFAWSATSNPAIQTIYSSARDVTLEKQLSEQLRQSQKLEAIGRLAGGVAHDFNNLLTVINGYAELLLAKSQPDSWLWEPLSTILDAGERATRLTAQLLAFSRKSIIQPKILDLNLETQSAVQMLHRLIGEDIQIATELSPELDKVRMDRGQFEQILVNLAVNARDAMPRGGQITISTDNVHRLPPSTSAVDESLARPYVRFRMSDTGEGMSPEVLAQMFEPFFTTKEVGKGTGLGLATVYGIVQQAEGDISVESELGRGTTFQILIPAIRQPGEVFVEGTPPAVKTQSA